jgi:hypothetical protein
MSVSEPVTQPVTEHVGPATVMPRQREAAETVSVPSEEAAVDHVRRHARSCYWDVAECRWNCG